ncbi:copper resistance protein CopC [Micromonospora sp. NPDC048871]|uniref:copper resistance CopC family protein n=1 Tax=Micromonospora sp. NPDC048871 TaxID=3364259 RepID=UPI0037235208
MRRLPRTPIRVTSGLLALLLATAVGILVGAAPAAAHGSLAMSTPKADATVTEPLTRVQLYFTEQVVPNAHFAVTAPGGIRIDNGWTQGEPRPLDQPVREYFLVDGTFQPREYTTGYPAVVNLAHLPATGRYTVSYLSVASDGEPVRGTLSFRYTGPVTPAPAGWRPPTDQPDPALVAAVDQHGHDAEPAPASAVPPASAPPAAAPTPPAEGGLRAGAWTGVAVAVAVALIGLLLWRRPTLAAGLLHRPSRTAPGRRPATGSRPKGKKKTTARSGATARSAAVTPRSGATARSGPATAKPGRGGTGSDRGITGSDRSATRSDRGSTGEAGAADRRGASVVAATRPRPSGDPVTVGLPAAAESAAPAESSALADEPVPTDRSSNLRLALLVGGLVIALLAGFGLGRIGGGEQPGNTEARPGDPGVPAGSAVGGGHQHPPGTGAHTHPGEDQVAGAGVSAAGYTLQPVQRSQPPGVRVDYQFRIVDGNRQPVTDFAVVHDKPLHLIVIGRDLSGYQHLHPSMGEDGVWRVPLELPRAGDYRLYADFSVTTADGRQLPLVLGVDHQVPGVYSPAQLPAPAPQATAGPYTVSMEGAPTIGLSAPIVLRVAGAAGPAELQPYLGAYGHLVVLREGDLGYVHVHPEPEVVDGAVTFWLTVPSLGRYRAFFDFQVDGKVHTAEFTLDLS